MDIFEKKKYCKNVMNSSKACFLTSINENGMPETRAMLNLRNNETYLSLKKIFDENEFIIYLTTNTSSSKMKQIMNNPNVSIYYCQPDIFQGVMTNGKIEVVNDIGIKTKLWQSNWNVYYPGGINDPDYTVLCLQPDIIKAYGNLYPKLFELSV